MENLQTASRGLAGQRGYHAARNADDAPTELHVLQTAGGDLQVDGLDVDAQKVGGLLDRQHLRVPSLVPPRVRLFGGTPRRPSARRGSDKHACRAVVIRLIGSTCSTHTRPPSELPRGSRGAGGGRDGGVAAAGRGPGAGAGVATGAALAGSDDARRAACQTLSRRKISRRAKSTVLNLASFAEMPDDFSTHRV